MFAMLPPRSQLALAGYRLSTTIDMTAAVMSNADIILAPVVQVWLTQLTLQASSGVGPGNTPVINDDTVDNIKLAVSSIILT